MTVASRRYAALAAAVFFFVSSGLAGAEALLVALQPRVARGEPAALYVRCLSLKSTEAIPGALELPGPNLYRPIQGLLGGRVGVVITQGIASGGALRPGDSRRALAAFTTSPLRRIPFSAEPAWEAVDVFAAPADEAEIGQRLVLVERAAGPSTQGGRILAFRARLEAGAIKFEALGTWGVAGSPVAAAVDWARGRAYVLSPGVRGRAVELAQIDLNSSAQRSVTLAVSRDDTVNSRPSGLALEAGGARLCLLTSAYSLAPREGGRISSARWIDAESLAAREDGLDVAGLGGPGVVALVPGAHGALWARTFDESAGFAYATSLDDRGTSPVKIREEAFREASAAPGVAEAPDGKTYLLAAGKNVRVVGANGSEAVARTFGQRVEAVTWGASGVFVGEGPRLHQLDPGTGTTIWSKQMNEGFIVDLFEISGDLGVASTAVPEVMLPARIQLDADTPGRDARVLTIPLRPGARARLVYDEPRVPWLRARTDESVTGQARMTLTLDKIAVPGPGAWTAEVDVRSGDAAGGSEAETSLGTIEISATSLGERVRTIEWQTSGVQRGAYDSLMELLSGPPLHLSHRLRRGPFSLAPRGSAAVVVRLEDVASGAITRQVLLDYVSGGGGLLVLAGLAPGIASEGLRRWLEPLGLLLDPAQEMKGRFAVGPGRLSAWGLDQLSVAAGAYVEVTRRMDLSVEGPSPRTAVLALMRHGYGRLGVMSGDAALGDRALSDPANRRFARALFGWLVGSNAVVRDSDGDGLRDDVEDANGNGVVDHGETNFLQADTDGDGIPDGMEDANLNGVVDEGETDPRRADTDGDGIPDGADTEPLPRAGSPVILAVRPASGPAEGGTLVEVEGRNLPVNSQVWFGDERATHVVRVDSTRLVAAAPPRPYGAEGRAIPLRVAHPLGIFENTLDAAYTYRDATAVRLTLDAAERVRRAYDGYRGALAITLDLADVRIDSGVFFVRTEPEYENLDVTLDRGAGLISAGRLATVTRSGVGEYRVEIGPGEPLTGHVELGTLRWFFGSLAPAAPRFRWYTWYPDFEVQWGGVAVVAPSERWVDLDAAVQRPAIGRVP